MSELPWFPFAPADFLSDINVAVMTTEEVGAYTLLLCYCWREGILANDKHLLAFACRMSPETFEIAWRDKIERCFVLTENGYIHPRLEKEREKQKQIRSARSISGRIGGQSKQMPSKCQASAKQVLKHGEANAKQLHYINIKEEEKTRTQARELKSKTKSEIIKERTKAAAIRAGNGKVVQCLRPGCGWYGHRDELHAPTDDPRQSDMAYNQCPKCESVIPDAWAEYKTKPTGGQNRPENLQGGTAKGDGDHCAALDTPETRGGAGIESEEDSQW